MRERIRMSEWVREEEKLHNNNDNNGFLHSTQERESSGGDI